jgi:hypoxanthine phosphoribosyltransferase
LIIGVLNGCIHFLSDLLKQLDFKFDLSFIRIKSYIGREKRETEISFSDDSVDYQNRKILIVDDIFDTGLTIRDIYNILISSDSVNSQDIETLFLAKKNNLINKHYEYLCHNYLFETDDKFLVGMGLDFDGEYRSLPYIGVLNEHSD